MRHDTTIGAPPAGCHGLELDKVAEPPRGFLVRSGYCTYGIGMPHVHAPVRDNGVRHDAAPGPWEKGFPHFRELGPLHEARTATSVARFHFGPSRAPRNLRGLHGLPQTRRDPRPRSGRCTADAS